jgi:hypothetical protein
MSASLVIAILILIILLAAILSFKEVPVFDLDEETTTTVTTTVHEPQYNVVGPLKRLVEGDQFFVIDPVDQKKIWLNSNDDMYEDADGKIWRLV